MPHTLNGVYWTPKELAKKTGFDYTWITKKLKKHEGVLNFGSFFLVPDDIAQEIIYANAYVRMSVACQGQRVNIGKQLLERILRIYKFPFIEKEGEIYIKSEHVEILKKAVEQYREQHGRNLKGTSDKEVAEIALRMLREQKNNKSSDTQK